MARFRKTYPLVNLNLYSDNSSEIRPWLRASTIDVAIITTPPTSPSFHVEAYRSEPLTAFISATHAFAERRLLPSDEATIPLIVRAGTPTKTRTEKEILSFRSKSIKLIIAMRCGSTQAVKQAVAHGAGIGILYQDAVEQDIERGEFKPIKIPGLSFKRQSYIVYSKGNPLSAAAEEFVKLLRESKTDSVNSTQRYSRMSLHRHSEYLDSPRDARTER